MNHRVSCERLSDQRGDPRPDQNGEVVSVEVDLAGRVDGLTCCLEVQLLGEASELVKSVECGFGDGRLLGVGVSLLDVSEHNRDADVGGEQCSFG
jgi:hypothetical protein